MVENKLDEYELVTLKVDGNHHFPYCSIIYSIYKEGHESWYHILEMMPVGVYMSHNDTLGCFLESKLSVEFIFVILEAQISTETVQIECFVHSCPQI